MDEKVTIQLEPYNALTILCFLREFEYDHRWVQSLADAVNRYEEEIEKNITIEQAKEAFMQRHLNQVMEREPREGK